MPITCFAEEVTESFQFESESFDFLLRDIVTRKDGKPDYADLVCAKTKMGLDDRGCNVLRRCHSQKPFPFPFLAGAAFLFESLSACCWHRAVRF